VTQQPLADIVGLFVVLAALAFSNEVAAIVAPYMVIIIASVVGASFSLGRREKTTRVSAILFFVRIAGLAMIATGLLSTLAISYQPDLSERLLLAPIALFIGWIGDDWQSVFATITRKLMTLLPGVRGGDKGDAP